MGVIMKTSLLTLFSLVLLLAGVNLLGCNFNHIVSTIQLDRKILDVGVSPCGRFLLAQFAKDKLVQCYNLSDKKKIFQQELEDCSECKFSPCGQYLAYLFADSLLQCYDFLGEKNQAIFKEDLQDVFDFGFDCDGLLIVQFRDGEDSFRCCDLSKKGKEVFKEGSYDELVVDSSKKELSYKEMEPFQKAVEDAIVSSNGAFDRYLWVKFWIESDVKTNIKIYCTQHKKMAFEKAGDGIFLDEQAKRIAIYNNFLGKKEAKNLVEIYEILTEEQEKARKALLRGKKFSKENRWKDVCIKCVIECRGQEM